MKNISKIVISPDSFKDSISAKDASIAIKNGLSSVLGDSCEYVIAPIADGGEGTLDAIVDEKNIVSLSVTGTSWDKVNTCYGFIGDTAVIEMARAAGLMLTPKEKRRAANATTYGVGELILDALDKGFRKILLTAGGSGTNDGGCGMISALGARFYDADGNLFVPTGKNLSKIQKIDASALDKRLGECQFTIATDVTNPLLGNTGATFVYGRQKGADDNELILMEECMKNYAFLLERNCNKKVSDIQGCGAGGGIATPLLAFTDAHIESGIESVLKAIKYNELIENADAVITGEGKIDRQSLFGKAISGVARYAANASIPVYCFVGAIGDDKELLLSMGLEDIYALSDIAPSVEYSMSHSDELLFKLGAELGRKLL